MKEQVLVANIQRFSLHDGPGIRTTVFLKGCSLCCPWCSNPETIHPYPEPFIRNGAESICGEWYGQDRLLQELVRDREFYKVPAPSGFGWQITSPEQIGQLPGGVTFSGGEPLLWMEEIVPVISALHEKEIHVACESALYVSSKQLELAMKHFDLFYVDLKILDPEKVKRIWGRSLEQYLQNLDRLLRCRRNGAGIPVVIRIPVISGYTDGREQRETAAKLLERYRAEDLGPLKVELLKEHHLGSSKYHSLGLPAPELRGIEDELMEEYCRQIRETGFEAQICSV